MVMVVLSALSSAGVATAWRENTHITNIKNGANIITRTIFTITAICAVFGSIALPIATTCATSCTEEPMNKPCNKG